MLKLIPWMCGSLIAIVIIDVLAAIFELAPALFIAIYVALCGYVIIETFRKELG